MGTTNSKRATFEMTRGRGAVLAISIGVFITILFDIALSIVQQTPLHLDKGWPAYVLQILLIAIPFLLMAFLGVRGMGAWLVGLGLTVALWGYVIFDVFSRLGDGSGTNIGMGLLLLASPILVSTACLIAARKELRRS